MHKSPAEVGGLRFALAMPQALCNDVVLGQDALKELQYGNDSCSSVQAMHILRQVRGQLSVVQQQIDAISLSLAPLNATIGKHSVKAA